MANQVAKTETRAFGGRDKERREREIRAIMNMEYADMVKIPEDVIPPGMVYGWGAYSVNNEPRPERIMQLRRKGWDFVPIERHPDLAFQGIGEIDPRKSGYIWRGGLVLMERPVEYEEIERKRLDEINYKMILSAPGLEGSAYPVNIKTEYYNGPMESNYRNADFG